MIARPDPDRMAPGVGGATAISVLFVSLLWLVLACDVSPASPLDHQMPGAVEVDSAGADDGEEDSEEDSEDDQGLEDEEEAAEDEEGAAEDDQEVAYPNEPPDFDPIAERSFSGTSEAGWSNVDIGIVSDDSAPRSPGGIGRSVFPAGWEGGYSPTSSETFVGREEVRRLYLSFWVKLSENWQGHGTGVNKVAIAWTHEKPVVVANVQGAGGSRLSSEIRLQDIPDGARSLSPNLDDPEIRRGEWHHWELILETNTGDSPDGEVHWWVDGRKAGEYRDIRFGRSGQSKIWDYATWRPIWGGRGDTVRETMEMWMDHYYVSGAR